VSTRYYSQGVRVILHGSRLSVADSGRNITTTTSNIIITSTTTCPCSAQDRGPTIHDNTSPSPSYVCYNNHRRGLTSKTPVFELHHCAALVSTSQTTYWLSPDTRIGLQAQSLLYYARCIARKCTLTEPAPAWFCPACSGLFPVTSKVFVRL